MRNMEDERRITEMVVRFMPDSPALVFIIQGKEEIVNKTNLEMGTPPQKLPIGFFLL
jgi:nucleoside diphosphate kinase